MGELYFRTVPEAGLLLRVTGRLGYGSRMISLPNAALGSVGRFLDEDVANCFGRFW